MTSKTFRKRTFIHAPVEAVFQWHARPGALERLTPPWEPLRVIEHQGGIQKGAHATVEMKIGPLPVTWRAEHIEYEENKKFVDRQVQGPFKKWVHAHLFEPAGNHGCYLTDEVSYELPFHPLSTAGGANFWVRRRLEKMFAYRHRVTRGDLARHQAFADKPRMDVLVSGASGVIGSTLVPFLTTGGHRVKRLVRNAPATNAQEVFWDPYAGQLDPESLQGIDAVIHMAGENIGQGRWTAEKKTRIMESRTRGTTLIAETISRLSPPPKVLVCASAIGYYGNRGECLLMECDGPGDDYISRVCDEWEKAAQPALEKGIRVVFLRIGIALTPAGGALQKLLLPFRLGLGGKIGSGEQYMSWIAVDDVVGAMHHALFTDLNGPVNVVSPNPATNAEFSKTLAKVLSRPAWFSVPAPIIQLMFGEMGKEVPLSSTRVLPDNLIESDYHFQYPDLKNALTHLLGRE